MIQRAHSSIRLEHAAHNRVVLGSNPSVPIFMKASALIYKENELDLISGKTTNREFGTCVIHPFKNKNFRALKSQLGNSELLLNDGSVINAGVEYVLEWSDKHEVHVVAIPSNSELRILVSSKNHREQTKITKHQECSVLIYRENYSVATQKVEFRYRDGEWNADIECKQDQKFRDCSQLQKAHHISFGSDVSFKDITSVIHS